MKIVKFCLLPLLVLVVGGGLAAWFFLKDMPTEWNVDVSTTIDAPAAEIHPYIEDLHRWKEWSAFREEFPDSAYSFEGAESGVGAVMTTTGEGGTMRVEITASDPAKGVWFDELLEGTISSKGVILFEESGELTRVTWQDHGSFGDFLLLRPFNLALEKALTEGFQANLERLKQLVEAAE
jgi:uncharacterized membrane protein